MRVYIVFDSDYNIDRIFLYRDYARIYVATEGMMEQDNWRQLADEFIEEHEVISTL